MRIVRRCLMLAAAVALAACASTGQAGGAGGNRMMLTADELRVETFFPADELTRQFFLGLGSGDG